MKKRLTIPTLYIVATPIGNLDDISQRALHILQTVDLIAAEDTRHSQGLLQHYHINKPLIALHSHNEIQQSRRLIQRLQEGMCIAYISDAGTPCIHDPGHYLVAQAHQHHIAVVPIPGPCAITTALSVSGLPHHPFLFVGFLPTQYKARQKQLTALSTQSYTLIFYEAPHRILDCLKDMCNIFGEQRQTTIARELTKQFETLYHGTLTSLLHQLNQQKDHCRGEFVILVAGQSAQYKATQRLSTQDKHLLTVLLAQLPMRQAVDMAHQITKRSKNKLYQLALAMQKRQKDATMNHSNHKHD